MSSRYISPFAREFSDDGLQVGAGYLLYFYSNSTTTPRDTYSDADLSTPNTNPVVADEDGRFGEIWLAGTYSVALKTAAGVQIWTADDVTGSGVSGFVGVFETADDLRDSTTPDQNNAAAITLGALAGGDGGGRKWYWDSSSADADTTGDTLLPTGHVGAGRWKAVPQAVEDVRCWGARTADSVFAAIDFSAGRCLAFTTETINIDKSIRFRNNSTYLCNGVTFAVPTTGGTFTRVLGQSLTADTVPVTDLRYEGSDLYTIVDFSGAYRCTIVGTLNVNGKERLGMVGFCAADTITYGWATECEIDALNAMGCHIALLGQQSPPCFTGSRFSMLRTSNCRTSFWAQGNAFDDCDFRVFRFGNATSAFADSGDCFVLSETALDANPSMRPSAVFGISVGSFFWRTSERGATYFHNMGRIESALAVQHMYIEGDFRNACSIGYQGIFSVQDLKTALNVMAVDPASGRECLFVMPSRYGILDITANRRSGALDPEQLVLVHALASGTALTSRQVTIRAPLTSEHSKFVSYHAVNPVNAFAHSDIIKVTTAKGAATLNWDSAEEEQFWYPVIDSGKKFRFTKNGSNASIELIKNEAGGYRNAGYVEIVSDPAALTRSFNLLEPPEEALGAMLTVALTSTGAGKVALANGYPDFASVGSYYRERSQQQTLIDAPGSGDPTATYVLVCRRNENGVRYWDHVGPYGSIGPWVPATGTGTRATFDTSTATVAQLAGRLKTVIDDLIYLKVFYE